MDKWKLESKFNTFRNSLRFTSVIERLSLIMAVDRRLLLDALSPIQRDMHKTHIWGQDIDVQFMKLGAIYINDLGLYKVPMRSEKLASIVNEHEKPVNIGFMMAASPEETISSRQIILPKILKPIVDQILKEKFAPCLENARMNVVIHPKGLVICRHSNSCVKLLNESTCSEAFATMFMQLPVDEETTVSANMDILVNGRKTNFEYQQKFPFHLTFVAGYQNSIAEVTIQSPAASNPIVFLHFQLLWPDSVRLVSNNLNANVFLEFLEKWKKANQALVGWEKISLNQFQEGLQPLSMFSSIETQENVLLCIPMRHSYHANEFKLGNLKPEDARTFNLLKTIHYLDVSIVILKVAHDEVKNETNWQLDHAKNGNAEAFSSIRVNTEAVETEEKTFSIHRWVHGDGTFPEFPCLRCDRYLVGDVTSVLEEANFDTDLNEGKLAKRPKLEVDSSRNFTYHPAVLILPRNTATFILWKFCPIQAIVRLKKRVKSALLQSNYIQRRRLLVEEVSFFLKVLPKDEDKLSECQRTAILYELLSVCTKLESVEEGLKIMELIPQRRCSCREAHTNLFDGCEHMRVEEIIIKFVSLAGWQICCNLVYGIYSRYEDADYSPLYNLSDALFAIGCVDGAIYFAKAYMRILAENCSLDEFEFQHLDYFVDLILRETSNTDEERKDIYALLRKVVLNNPDALQFLIMDYFSRVRKGEEHLNDLKLTIAGLINEIDCFADEPTVFFVICFAHRTQDAELTDRLWLKLLTITDEQNEEGQFEEMLLDALSWNDMDGCEDLYRAIALSPVVTERFYKFIEKQKTDLDTMNACCYHLTMAQNEPSLADELKLQSFISTFKEMSVESLMSVTESFVFYKHNAIPLGAPDISQTIITALLESLPTNDLSSLLAQETDVFCDIMYCYQQLGSDNAKNALARMLEETCCNDILDELDLENDETLLPDAWFACLKKKLADEPANHSTVAYHVLSFFRVHLYLNGINLPHEVEAKHFTDLWPTCEFLEKTLVALYERERKRASECLKVNSDSSIHWKICQVLSDVLASDQDLRMVLLGFREPERIVKLMCCIFWLGSPIATEKFAILLRSLPSRKTKYCLSLFVLSNDELQTCAISSSCAFSALQSLIRHCIKQLFSDVACASTWARRDEVGDTDVKKFYQSEDESRSFFSFTTRDEAQKFADSATKGLPWADYIIRNHGSSYSCTIMKLYPVLVDAAFNSEIPAICKNLRKSCNDFLPEGSPVDDVSKMPQCSVCLAPSLASR